MFPHILISRSEGTVPYLTWGPRTIAIEDLVVT